MAKATSGFGKEFGSQFGAGLSASIKETIDNVLIAAGIDESNTEYRKVALTHLTYVQQQALKGRHWKFMVQELFLDLQEPYRAGTVTLTEGSYDVTEDLDTDAVPVIQWNSTMIGMKFYPEQRNQEFYRIRAIENSKKLNLASVFAGDTATIASYQILFDRYKLNASIQAIGSLSLSGIGEIKPIGLQKFRQMESFDPGRTGFPEYYTIVNMEEDTGQATIEFYPSPDKRYSCRIEYLSRVLKPADEETCYPVIPPEHMDVLFYGTLAEIYAHQENPAMSAKFSKDYQASLRLFRSDQNMTDPVARVQQGRNYFNRFSRRRWPGHYGLRWFGKVED